MVVAVTIVPTAAGIQLILLVVLQVPKLLFPFRCFDLAENPLALEATEIVTSCDALNITGPMTVEVETKALACEILQTSSSNDPEIARMIHALIALSPYPFTKARIYFSPDTD